MVTRFGNSAEYWFKLARGIDDRQVNPDRERKSIGAEDTFADDISTIEEARRMVMPLVEKVWKACEKRGLAGRTATLKVKFADFEQITRSKSQTRPFRTKTVLADLMDILLLPEFPPRVPVRLLGVTVSNFVSLDERVDNQIEMVV